MKNPEPNTIGIPLTVESLERMATVTSLRDARAWWRTEPDPAVRQYWDDTAALMRAAYGYDHAIGSEAAGSLLPRAVRAWGVYLDPEATAERIFQWFGAWSNALLSDV